MFPVALPRDAWKVEDAAEEIFLLYSQLQASSGTGGQDMELGGLGSVDSLKGELAVRIDVPHPDQDQSGTLETSSKDRRVRLRSKKPREPVPNWGDPVEVVLFQDTTALRTRQGDTGSVLWRASVHLARFLLTQQRFPPQYPFLSNAFLSNCHIYELGAGTGLLSIVLAPHVARYTATDLPSLLPLIRKNQAHNLSPSLLARVEVDDLDWVQLHNTPVRARPSICTPPARSTQVFAASSPRKDARKKRSSSATTHLQVEPTAAGKPGLVLVVDCIYNPALIPPLLSTLVHVAGAAPVLIVLELRASDVAHEFLEGWLALPDKWEIWSIPILGPKFAVWVGKRIEFA